MTPLTTATNSIIYLYLDFHLSVIPLLSGITSQITHMIPSPCLKFQRALITTQNMFFNLLAFILSSVHCILFLFLINCYISRKMILGFLIHYMSNCFFLLLFFYCKNYRIFFWNKIMYSKYI